MLRVSAATGNQDCSSLRWPFEALHRRGLGPACAPCDAVWCEQPKVQSCLAVALPGWGVRLGTFGGELIPLVILASHSLA